MLNRKDIQTINIRKQSHIALTQPKAQTLLPYCLSGRHTRDDYERSPNVNDVGVGLARGYSELLARSIKILRQGGPQVIIRPSPSRYILVAYI